MAKRMEFTTWELELLIDLVYDEVDDMNNRNIDQERLIPIIDKLKKLRGDNE